MAASLTDGARKNANLRLLQRSIDANIEDIIGTATHVVLYEYIAPQGWEKSQVEGSLFLAAAAKQQYSLAILNRHSTENFHVQVTDKFQLQHKEPYLIFKQSPKILGIWFHNANERDVMASLLHQIIENLKQSAAVAAPASPDHLLGTTQLRQQPHPPQLTEFSTAVFPKVQSFPQQAAISASGQTQVNVASPMQLIEPLMNSLFVSPIVSGEAVAGHPPGHATANNQPIAGPESGSRTPTGNIPGVALDKKSLQLALLSLIQDERFIDLLHAQYLKVAHARAHRNNKR